jgi:hypothetical protein
MIFAGKSAPSYFHQGDELPQLHRRRIVFAVSAVLLAIALMVMGH